MQIKKLFMLNRCFKYSFRSLSTDTGDAHIVKRKYNKRFTNFFLEYPHLLQIRQLIPGQYLTVTKGVVSDSVYLICPKVAKEVVGLVEPHLDLSNDQIIAETNAGLGLITQELIKIGIPVVRMYEHCEDFRFRLRVSKKRTILYKLYYMYVGP